MQPQVLSAEAYRRAVELNPRDYRAWYGLGQTYELLRMPFYALYYFRRATQLRPHDARMWCAMGQCYENDQLQSVDKDKMEVAAIRCYRRAVQNKDREGIALHKLVRLPPQHGLSELCTGCCLCSTYKHKTFQLALSCGSLPARYILYQRS